MDPIEVLTQWLRGIRIFHIAHFRAAARCSRMGRFLGVPVVILTTIVGTAIFATLNEAQSDSLRIVAGVLSMLAAILSGVQTFLDYSAREQKHHQAAVAFARLRREVEEFLSFFSSPQDQREFMKKTRDQWDALVDSSPDVSQAIYDKARSMISRTGK